MQLAASLILLTGFYPLGKAWQANRSTSLSHAIPWSIAAWTAWGGAFLAARWPGADNAAVRYFALCLTACAGIAVLGARRPGVGAWNFVVVSLLAVLMLPLTESLTGGPTLRLPWYRGLLLGASLAVGFLNYLPTGLGPAVLLAAMGCALETLSLAGPESLAVRVNLLVPLSRCLLAFAPWAAFALAWSRRPASEFDRDWLAFRDRFGFVWAQRLRQQFNAAAANARWPVVLYWQGLRLVSGQPSPDHVVQTAMLAALRALMKRFGPEADGK